MKKLGFKWVTALAAGIVLFTAASCSSEDGETIYITNPALQDKAVKAGDKGEIAFTATGNWSINNDSPEWLTLGSSTGSTGDQKISYEVKDANLAFDKEDKAKITLTTTGGTFNCIFTRAAKERTIQFFDGPTATEEVAAVEVKDMTGDGRFMGRLAMIPNFDWELASYPDWVTPSTTEGIAAEGEDAQRTTIFFDLNADAITTTGKDGLIVFTAPANDKFTLSIPIKFFGAEPNNIAVDMPPMSRFSVDGFLYASDWATVTEADAISFSIQSMDGAYQILAFNMGQYGPTYMDLTGFNAWIGYQKVQKTRANINTDNFELYVKAYPQPTEERSCYVTILPAVVYTKLMGTVGGNAEYLTDELFAWNAGVYTPNPDYDMYMFKVQQDGPAGLEITSDYITTPPQNEGGILIFSGTIPANVTSATFTVKLPAEYAGILPKQANGSMDPFKIQFSSDLDPSVDVEGTVTISNVADDGSSYDLVVTLPANTSTTADRSAGELTFFGYDNPDAPVAVLSIYQDRAQSN